MRHGVKHVIISFSVPCVTYLKALYWIWCPKISLNSALGKKNMKNSFKIYSCSCVSSSPFPTPSYLGAFVMVHHSVMHNFLGCLFVCLFFSSWLYIDVYVHFLPQENLLKLDTSTQHVTVHFHELNETPLNNDKKDGICVVFFNWEIPSR